MNARATAPADSLDSKFERPSAVCIGVRAGSSLLINAAATEVLKHTVHELRPDRSENNSFPSRHSSWAFALSSTISNELYSYSPWIPWLAQGAASAVGLQRVVAKRHYGSDVVAGAAIGIASAQLGYHLGNLITGHHRRLPCADARFRTSLSLFSEAVYNLSSPEGSELCTGFATGLRVVVPVSARYGLSATARAMSAPLKYGGINSPLSALGLTVGGTAHYLLPCQGLALEPALEAGLQRNLKAGHMPHPVISFVGELSCALSWHLTEKFAFRPAVSYRLITLKGVQSAVSLSVASVVLF